MEERKEGGKGTRTDRTNHPGTVQDGHIVLGLMQSRPAEDGGAGSGGGSAHIQGGGGGKWSGAEKGACLSENTDRHADVRVPGVPYVLPALGAARK